MPFTTGSDGTRVFYQPFGRADGEPLLMVQGLGQDHNGWLMQRFPFGARYRCVAADNRGAGRSDAPEGPYDLEQMADDLVRVLDDADIATANVMGVSMGGILAQILAVRNPDRVRSLVLASTACHHHRWRRELLQEWADLAQADGMAAFSRKNLRWIVGVRAMARFWPAMRLFGPVAFDMAPAAFASQIQGILAADDSLRDQLHHIDVPTLVIVGSQDILTPQGDSEELAALIPGARLAVIRGGAHGAIVEHATEFNRTVLDFLDEINNPGYRPLAGVQAAFG